MQSIEIRDQREKSMYRVDDAYLNGYAKLCGIAATAVYNSLCRHVNINQQSWPSIELIANQHSISKWTVFRAIKRLEFWGIIRIEKSKDPITKRQKNNVYTLVNKSKWKPKPSSINALGTIEPSSKSRVAQTSKSRVAPQHQKDTQREGITSEGEKIKKGTYEGRPISMATGKLMVKGNDGVWRDFAGSEKDIVWR